MQKIEMSFHTKKDMEEVRRQEKFTKERNRSFLIKITKENKKTTILKWLDQDYSKSVQKERKILVERMKETRRKGYGATIRYSKLIMYEAIDNQATRGLKRTLLDRSPQGRKLHEEELKKITR